MVNNVLSFAVFSALSVAFISAALVLLIYDLLKNLLSRDFLNRILSGDVDIDVNKLSRVRKITAKELHGDVYDEMGLMSGDVLPASSDGVDLDVSSVIGDDEVEISGDLEDITGDDDDSDDVTGDDDILDYDISGAPIYRSPIKRRISDLKKRPTKNVRSSVPPNVGKIAVLKKIQAKPASEEKKRLIADKLTTMSFTPGGLTTMLKVNPVIGIGANIRKTPTNLALSGAKLVNAHNYWQQLYPGIFRNASLVGNGGAQNVSFVEPGPDETAAIFAFILEFRSNDLNRIKDAVVDISVAGKDVANNDIVFPTCTVSIFSTPHKSTSTVILIPYRKIKEELYHIIYLPTSLYPTTVYLNGAPTGSNITVATAGADFPIWLDFAKTIGLK